MLVFFFFFCACLLDSKPPEYGAERQGLPAYLSKKRKQREQEKLQTGSRVDWRGFRRNLNAHTWSPARQDFDSHSLSEAGFGFDFFFSGMGGGVLESLSFSWRPSAPRGRGHTHKSCQDVNAGGATGEFCGGPVSHVIVMGMKNPVTSS